MGASRKFLSWQPARTLCKSFIVLCISLTLIELLMTVFEPQLFRGLFQYDPDLGFRVRPYAPTKDGATTNQFGFNARDYPSRQPGVFRILAIGDSFNWAGGLNGNYTAMLERKLDSAYGNHRVDVINVGYPGTHTAEQLAMLKKFGLQYTPDLVILGFFAGNDFIDANPNRKRIVVNDTYVDIDKRYERKLLGRPIILRSRLYLFLRQKYIAWKEQRAAANEAGAGSFPRETFLKIEKNRLDFFSLPAARAQKYQPNIDYILQSISEMDALLRSRHIALLVAIFPDELQVNQTLLTAVLDRYQLDARDYDIEMAQKVLKAFLDTKGIPYVDFLDRFRALESQESLYTPQDTHWNPAGNELAAEILFETLSRRRDVPKWSR